MRTLIVFIFIFILKVVSSQGTSANRLSAYDIDSSIRKIDSSLSLLNKMTMNTKKALDSIHSTLRDIERAEKSEVMKASLTSNTKQVENTTLKKVLATKEYYTVEVNSTMQPLGREHTLFKKFPDLNETHENGLFRYTIGKFSTELKAKEFVEYIRERGHMGSIVKYENGKRVLK